jgi:hypothetical protein
MTDDRVAPLLALKRVGGYVACPELLVVVVGPRLVGLDEGVNWLDDLLGAQLGCQGGDVGANDVADLPGGR